MNLVEINKFILTLENYLFKYTKDLKLSSIEKSIIYENLQNIQSVNNHTLFNAYKKANKVIGDINPNQSMIVIRNWYLDGLLNNNKLEKMEIKEKFIKNTDYIFYKINEKNKFDKEIFSLLKEYNLTKNQNVYLELEKITSKNPIYFKGILKQFDNDIDNITLEELSEVKLNILNKNEKLKGVVGMVENEQVYINGIVASQIELNTIKKGENTEKIANFRLQNKNEEGKIQTYFVSINEEDLDLIKDLNKFDLIQASGYLEENNGYNNFFIKNMEKSEISKDKYPNLLEFKGNLAFDPILEERDGSLGEFKYIEISIYDENNKIFRCKAVNNVAIELAKHNRGDYVKVSGELSEYLGKDGNVYEEFKVREVNDVKKKIKFDELSLVGNLAEKPVINTKKYEEKEFIYSNFAIYENLDDDKSKIWYCNAINEVTESLKDLNKGDLIEVKGFIQKDVVNGKEYENFKVKEIKQISKKKDKEINKIQDRDYDGDGVKDIHDADFRDREVETFGDLDQKEKEKIKESNKGRAR